MIKLSKGFLKAINITIKRLGIFTVVRLAKRCIKRSFMYY